MKQSLNHRVCCSVNSEGLNGLWHQFCINILIKSLVLTEQLTNISVVPCSRHVGPEKSVRLTEYHLDAGILMLAKSFPLSAAMVLTVKEKGMGGLSKGCRHKRQQLLQTSYFSSFPSLPNTNQMQCWVLVRGMKRQMSIISDNELTTTVTLRGLSCAGGLSSTGDRLAMARDNILLNREKAPCWLNLSTYLSAMLSKGNSEF